ncbi:CAAX amino terminal protease family protein [Catonella morbi ATCC 51271]|uniref:CAAX amino terminal protease family protein n=1 Tax=Catonella morbi ATCC 51271 TaxID=592026 RepID=V2Y0L6_9FIRM|nr:CPBP family glutamic-type intramembrane protease [Catonella morbi]ESL02528.1 CAAX amino terminal protease family protein [Catonella morbi ATCC 51271]
MKNRRAITIKLAMFLVLCVCLISIYCITVPTKNIQYKPYTFHLFGIIYTFIILCSVVIIDFEKLAKKDYIIALCLGLLSIGVTSPVNYMGIISGICAFFAYLGSVTLNCNYESIMLLLRFGEVKDIMKSIAIIIFIGCIFIFMEWLGQNPLRFSFDILSIFRALGAGVSEEVIFRLFIFSVIVYMCKGKEPPKLLAFLIMVIPFALLHVIDEVVVYGFFHSLPALIQVCLVAAPITILAWKRDLFTAMGVHFIYDVISMSLLKK